MAGSALPQATPGLGVPTRGPPNSCAADCGGGGVCSQGLSATLPELASTLPRDNVLLRAEVSSSLLVTPRALLSRCREVTGTTGTEMRHAIKFVGGE